MVTAKRILERRGIQTSSYLSKFDGSLYLNLKTISYFSGIYMASIFQKKPFQFLGEI